MTLLFNENKFRTSWVYTFALSFGFFLGGVVIGLMFLGRPEYQVMGFIVTIVVACILHGVRHELIRYESVYIEMLHEARKEEFKLLKQQEEIKQLEVKSKPNYTFTSDDFDDAAQAILLKPIRESRKKKVRVTGQGLVETFLRSIK